MSKSHLERVFEISLEAVKAPKWEREFRFHPERKWRFDFAWVDRKVAVEIDGGIFKGGGHNRGMAFNGDCEKLNAATMLGWRVLRFTTISIREQPIQCAELLKELLET